MQPQKRVLLTVFLTLLMDLIGFSIIFPLFPAMLDYYLGHESEWFVTSLKTVCFWMEPMGSKGNFLMTVLFGGFLAALYSFLQFIFSPIWGGLSDRLGRRPVILMSIAGTCVGYGLWVFSGSFLLLMLSRVITGAMSANMAVATAAIADITDDASRSKGMAWIGIAFGVGFILGPLIGGMTAGINLLTVWPEAAAWGMHPFSMPALMAFGLSVCNGLWAYYRLDETLPLHKRSETEWISPWRRLLSFIAAENKGVRWISWVNFWFIFIFSGMEFSLNFLAKERFAFTPMDNGLLFTYLGVVMVLTQGGVVRRFAHQIGERLMCILGLLMGVVGFVGLALANTPLLFCLAAGIMAFTSGLMNTLMALASLYSTANHQGRDMGIFRSAASLGRFFGPLIAAFVYFSLGASSAYLLGGIGLLGPLGMLLCLSKQSV